MASKREVESRLRALIERLHQADGAVHDRLADALPDPRIMVLYVPDLEATYWTKLDAGRLGPLHRGSPPASDIRIRADSDDLLATLNGERSLFTSYLAGHIKVEASLSDLLRLRRLA